MLFQPAVADPDSHSEDHEGVLVPEPTGPPHSAARQEDAVKVGPRQQLQRGKTQAGHLDADVGTTTRIKGSKKPACGEKTTADLSSKQIYISKIKPQTSGL